ncbi:MAG: T9SS type A sorting domain-containing protein [Saprospiraceae bacterium]
MRKQLFIIFSLGLLVSLRAQNKKLTPQYNPCKESFLTDTLNPADWVCHNTVRNTSGGTLKLLWKREDVMVPILWEPTVCDNVNCYATFIKECPRVNVNEIAKGSTMLADIHVYDAGVPGAAHIKFRVFEQDDTTNFIVIDYLFNKEFVGTKNLRNLQLRMYPNPAMNSFNVDYNTGISRIELYSVLGTKVLSFITEPSKSYDIGNLEDGLYMVKFITTDGRALRTLRLQKKSIRS